MTSIDVAINDTANPHPNGYGDVCDSCIWREKNDLDNADKSFVDALLNPRLRSVCSQITSLNRSLQMIDLRISRIDKINTRHFDSASVDVIYDVNLKCMYDGCGRQYANRNDLHNHLCQQRHYVDDPDSVLAMMKTDDDARRVALTNEKKIITDQLTDLQAEKNRLIDLWYAAKDRYMQDMPQKIINDRKFYSVDLDSLIAPQQDKVRQYQQQIDDLKTLQNNTQRLIDTSGKANMLNGCRNDIAAIDDKIVQIKNNIRDCTLIINKLQRQKDMPQHHCCLCGRPDAKISKMNNQDESTYKIFMTHAQIQKQKQQDLDRLKYLQDLARKSQQRNGYGYYRRR